jgi:hypothetical protein
MERSRDDTGSGGGGDIVRASDEGKARGFCVAGGRVMANDSSSSDHHPSRSSVTSVQYQQQPQYVAPQAPRRWHKRVAQRLERWIFLYNVTTGLYMLDWWERCIFNAVFLLFFAVAGYNSGHYLQRIAAGLLAWAYWGEPQEAPLGDGGAAG